jgi:metal-responsive CopG/Arc/MetJ family transcriptional regulator
MIKPKKKSIGITIDKELNEKLEKYLKEKKLSKSEYIEFLIKKDKE